MSKNPLSDIVVGSDSEVSSFSSDDERNLKEVAAKMKKHEDLSDADFN